MPRFSDLLILFSGANPNYLEQCPNERQKFLPIGLSIFVTTLLAIISMYYAANLIFSGMNSGNKHVFIILFSLFWGLAIFSIDWGLVKTMKKRKKERSFLLKLLTVPVLFRLAVAVLISFSISRPLELAIYEQRLKAQIEADKQEFIRQETNKRKAELLSIQESLDTLLLKGEEIVGGQLEGPKSELFQGNMEEYKKCNGELTTLQKRNQIKINNLNTNIRNIKKDPAYKDAINFKLTKDALNSIKKYENSIYRFRIEVDKKKKACLGFLQIANREAERINETWQGREKRISTLFEDQLKLKKEKEKQDSIVAVEIRQKADISFNSDNPGLITSLAALANFEKTPEGEDVWIVRIILLLIFICIDTAPIVVKLLTKYGPYEEMQEADEAKMRYLATAEKNANMLLISNIATAQNRVLRLAIDQYEKEELDNLKSNNGYYKNYVHDNKSPNDTEG